MKTKEDTFIAKFIDQFAEPPTTNIDMNTNFKDLEGWDSLTSMMVLAMFNDNYDTIVSPEEMLKANTLRDLFNLV